MGSQTNDTGTGSRTSGRTGSGPSAERLGFSTCAFWLGQRRFGLDVALVGEVTQVEHITPVPLTHPALTGLFNLRGMPLPAVELASVLDFEQGRAATGRMHTALVVRSGDLVAGLLIDRMDAVVPAGVGAFTPPASADEHPLVVGFLEGADGLGVITVLDSAGLVTRLARVGFDTAREA